MRRSHTVALGFGASVLCWADLIRECTGNAPLRVLADQVLLSSHHPQFSSVD